MRGLCHFQPLEPYCAGANVSQVVLRLLYKPALGEGMQPKTGHAHIGNAARRVKPDPNISEFHNMLGSRPARIIVFVMAS